ncbi:MAG: HEAT repeat domain-containing protein [Melioribacteraceae bacterium]|nr:HEAT repeat domain-containing protein [Melioribacteraceae bacterium]
MSRIFLISALLMFFSSSLVFSQDSIQVFSKLTDEDIELNLLEGVNSDNLGLRVSAAYFLGERKSQKSVIPLMKILREDKSPEARIMAALSLFKIGDDRGLFAVKQAIKFDDNEQVKKMCEILTQMYGK